MIKYNNTYPDDYCSKNGCTPKEEFDISKFDGKIIGFARIMGYTAAGFDGTNYKDYKNFNLLKIIETKLGTG